MPTGKKRDKTYLPAYPTLAVWLEPPESLRGLKKRSLNVSLVERCASEGQVAEKAGPGQMSRNTVTIDYGTILLSHPQQKNTPYWVHPSQSADVDKSISMQCLKHGNDEAVKVSMDTGSTSENTKAYGGGAKRVVTKITKKITSDHFRNLHRGLRVVTCTYSVSRVLALQLQQEYNLPKLSRQELTIWLHVSINDFSHSASFCTLYCIMTYAT